jgi:hypothetical protein
MWSAPVPALSSIRLDEARRELRTTPCAAMAAAPNPTAGRATFFSIRTSISWYCSADTSTQSRRMRCAILHPLWDLGQVVGHERSPAIAE